MTEQNATLHPELRSIARFLPRTILTRRTLPVLKRLSAVSARRVPRGVTVEEVSPGAQVRVHLPPPGDGGDGGALVWIHGGGYVMGSAAQDDRLCGRLARRIGRPVYAVEYRLAPEHPYPAALEDCYAALVWVASQEDVAASRIAVAGASAGGGLAAALSLLARDRDEVRPIFQLLAYPMADAPREGDRDENPAFRIWNHASNRLGWSAYLGGADPATVAPLRRPDLSGLPPAWLGVGDLDPLHEEGLAYAGRLREAGVPCHTHVVAGAFHGFDMILPSARVSRDFFDRQVAALNAAFEQGS